MLLGLMHVNKTISIFKDCKRYLASTKINTKTIPTFLLQFCGGFFCFWFGVLRVFFHFYADVTALTLVGCEVYFNTNNREKSISFCRYTYSSSQNE